jgi:hypothetical protein
MQETCKCGQNKIATETDGRFAYQICSNCGDVMNVLYLGPKSKDEDVIHYDEEVLGL